MADNKKFEEMLERLINEDREGAQELFHEIVVEKSRDIYESLLEDEEVDEADDEEVDEADDDEEVDESEDDEVDESDDEDLDEGFDLDEFEVEAEPDMGGDPTDDMMSDLTGDDEDDMDMDMDMDDAEADDSDDEEIEDRVDDLEDALEDLKSEFEQMMGGDDEDDMDMDSEDDEDDMDMDMDVDMDDASDDDDEEKESFYNEAEDEDDDDEMDEGSYKKKSKKSPGEEMREYVEKIQGGDLGSKIGGDNGANTKSSVAGKNDMGGTSQNILRTDTEESGESGAAGGQIKGSALNDQSPKDMSTGNVNVPGGKAGKTGFKKSQPGHGAEKKGKPETADKGAGSTLNKVSSRAK